MLLAELSSTGRATLTRDSLRLCESTAASLKELINLAHQVFLNLLITNSMLTGNDGALFLEHFATYAESWCADEIALVA